MDRLYAPWRSSYVKKENGGTTECPFCVIAARSDDDACLVLFRTDDFFVVMNRFPYNTGHLLIIPNAHVSGLEDVSSQIRSSMMDAVVHWCGVLTKKLKCQGFNVGFNLGTVSGGSIPGHIHMHIVPRWSGDTNFLATISEVKLVSSDVTEVYRHIVSCD